MYLKGNDLLREIELATPEDAPKPTRPEPFQTHILIKNWSTHPGRKLKCGHKKEVMFDAVLQDKVAEKYAIKVRFWECAECGAPQSIGLSSKVVGAGSAWSTFPYTYNSTYSPVEEERRKRKEKLLKEMEALKKDRASIDTRLFEIKTELNPYG